MVSDNRLPSCAAWFWSTTDSRSPEPAAEVRLHQATPWLATVAANIAS